MMIQFFGENPRKFYSQQVTVCNIKHQIQKKLQQATVTDCGRLIHRQIKKRRRKQQQKQQEGLKKLLTITRKENPYQYTHTHIERSTKTKEKLSEYLASQIFVYHHHHHVLH